MRALKTTLPLKSDPLVDILSVVPDVVLDIRYAGADNVFKTIFYPFPAAFLRRSAAKKLAQAAAGLRRRGYRLRVFDAYRPLSVQRRMWALKPDARFVAEPGRGSAHNRAAAVDVSLASRQGRRVAMSCDFDDFSARAGHGFAAAPPQERRHAALLRGAMEAAGFCALAEEWWHYADPELKSAPLLDVAFEDLG